VETEIPTYDAVHLARDRFGGLLVVAHEMVWTVSEHTLPAATQQTYLFVGLQEVEGAEWSFALPVAMTASPSGRDASLHLHRDGTLEWIYRASGGVIARRRCRSLTANGTGTWS
jgi:hypothetical protein